MVSMKYRRFKINFKVFCIVFLICGCTVLRIAPRPDLTKIQYKRDNVWEGTKINVLVEDRRRNTEHSQELVAIFKNIIEKQIEFRNGKISPDGTQLTFELKSYDFANSNTGCTIIISYQINYLSSEKSSIVTEDSFPCLDSETKSSLASHTVNKTLREVIHWIATISK